MAISFDILEKAYNLKMSGKTWVEVGSIVNINETTLIDNLKKYNFDLKVLPKNKSKRSKRKNITEEEKQKAFKLKEEGLTLDVISKKLNIPKYSLRRLGVHKINKEVDRVETYFTDLNYFNEINSEDKAYYLGLICADGSVDKERLRVELQQEDCYILERWRDIISPGRPIYYSQRKNKKAVGCLILNSKYWLSKLNIYNIKPRKSFINTSIPKLSNQMMPHFIRGVFDGDGSIYLNSKKTGLQIKLIGNTLFITELLEYLVKELSITSVKIHFAKSTQTYTSYFTISREDDIKKLYDYMYKDCSYYLIRKKNKFTTYFSN